MKRSIYTPLALLIGLCLDGLAMAQINESTFEPSFIVYKIKPGDNISKLAQKYFTQTVNLEEIQKVNQLQNIDLLTIGSNLNIPRQFVKTKSSTATIIGLSCATAIRVDSSTKPLNVGSVVAEGAIIEVPAECHASLLLEDGSVIRLPSSASLKITTLRKNPLESAPEVKLDLARGRVELDVNKNRSKSTPFEVRTPLSIMGVRGTEFRVGYSPDEQMSQVEVLGGTVQTRGSSDTVSHPITKGLGVAIDSDGKALGIEKLLDAPVFASAHPTQGTTPSYVVALTPVNLASYYTAVNANTANFNEAKSSQQLLTPELFIPRLSKQATFYQLSSTSESGLIGIERNYAFCAAPSDPQTARCSAIFSAPLAEGSAINFQISRTNDQVSQPLINAQNLQARNGRFAIQGLPAGKYSWSLSYVMNDGTGASSKKQLHAQSGSFELILLPADKP